MAADTVNRIRVVLVDDQTLVRQGLKSLLAMLPDIEVVGEAEGGEQAVALIPEVGPDAVLLDLRMPGMDGLEVLQKLREADALPPTLILTTFDEDALLLEAVRRGARGFLLKDVSLERLAEAIRTVAGGGTLIQPTLTERIVKAALA
ncbi:MAG TPA: response regulator transcription factor, partial [Thermoanaerobaculia bacterium]|nr:response regulator transcription factor [Thermoanaerobaculia bacterium]